jgi:hypothetical protein
MIVPWIRQLQRLYHKSVETIQGMENDDRAAYIGFSGENIASLADAQDRLRLLDTRL